MRSGMFTLPAAAPPASPTPSSWLATHGGEPGGTGDGGETAGSTTWCAGASGSQGTNAPPALIDSTVVPQAVIARMANVTIVRPAPPLRAAIAARVPVLEA